MEQQDGICWGNAQQDGVENQGWLISPYQKEGSPLHQRGFQFKVHYAKAGLEKPAAKATKDDDNWTVQFVAFGRVRTSFPATEKRGEKHVEVGPGEYCIWGPGVLHYWKILEDTLVITSRWPAELL